jgi:hypothetical protein
LDAFAELDDGKGGVKKAIWETALNLLAVKTWCSKSVLTWRLVLKKQSSNGLSLRATEGISQPC